MNVTQEVASAMNEILERHKVEYDRDIAAEYGIHQSVLSNFYAMVRAIHHNLERKQDAASVAPTAEELIAFRAWKEAIRAARI